MNSLDKNSSELFEAPLDDLGKMIIDYLSNYLSYTLGKEKARLAAEALVLKYGSLGVISGSSVEELARVKGMTQSSALSVKLLCSIYSRSITDSFEFGRKHSEEEICEYLRALCFGLSVETVYALFLDSAGRVISCELVGEGIVNYSEIYLRKLVEFSSILGAKSVIVAHNHPKGRAVASSADLVATVRLSDVLRTAGTSLLAHYVVSDKECCKVAL